jgi:hypothetical protein
MGIELRISQGVAKKKRSVDYEPTIFQRFVRSQEAFLARAKEHNASDLDGERGP